MYGTESQRSYFCFNSFISFFEAMLLIWLNLLVPGVPKVYPQHHLNLSFTMF